MEIDGEVGVSLQKFAGSGQVRCPEPRRDRAPTNPSKRSLSRWGVETGATHCAIDAGQIDDAIAHHALSVSRCLVGTSQSLTRKPTRRPAWPARDLGRQPLVPPDMIDVNDYADARAKRLTKIVGMGQTGNDGAIADKHWMERLDRKFHPDSPCHFQQARYLVFSTLSAPNRAARSSSN